MEKRFAGSAYRYFLIWSSCASLAITVCTIVDALLVGNLVGSDGLAVANLSTPVFLLYALFGVTIGVGANVSIARALGAGEVASANRAFRAQLGFGLLVGALCLCPLCFKDAWFSFLGVTAELYPLAEQYLTVVMWSAPVFVVYHILSVSVRTDSDPRRAAAASAVVIVTNLTLDLLFMQGLGWGIIGASASLCIAEALGVAVLLTHFLKKGRLLTLRAALPTRAEMGSFVYNGFGMGSASIFGAAVMLVFNALLLRAGGAQGALYVALYGVIYTVGTVPGGLFDGASNALSTVTAFFIGESDIDGIFTVLKRALAAAVAGGSALALLCAAFPGELLWLFGLRDGAALAGAATAMRLYAASLVLAGINTVATAFWQSGGRARLAGAMSVVRNCLLLLAVGAVLIPRGAVVGLAGAYFCTELICTLAVLAVELRLPSRRYLAERYGLDGRCFEKSYRIRRESMEEISGDLERVCEAWALGAKESFLVSFICEELLLNIIKFALSDTERDCYISIKLMERGEEHILRIRDNVSHYDPFASEGDEIDAGVLRLIRRKTKYCDYQRKLIFNYFYTVI